MTWTKSARPLPSGGILRQADSNRRFTPGRSAGLPEADAPPSSSPTASGGRGLAASPSRSAPPAADPASAEALLALALADGTSMQELAEQARGDEALDAALRRAALQRRPDLDSGSSLSQIILSLGLSEARMLTAGYAIFSLLPEGSSAEVRTRVGEGCLRRGVLAALLAEARGDIEIYPAFAAGMMAEAGLLWLADPAACFSAPLEGISRHPGEERIHAERLLTGSDHAQAAAAMAPPGPIREALRAHHSPDASDTLALTIAAADRVAELAEITAPRSHLPRVEDALARAGGRPDAAALLRDAAPRVLALAAALQIPVGRQPDPALLLLAAVTAAEPLAPTALLAATTTESDGASLLAQMDNRARILQRLELLRRRQEGSVLIAFNIDLFRRVNDTYGVPAGDLVLQSLIEGVQGCLSGPADRIGRLGGDTFLVVMPGGSSKIGQVTAERIRSLVERSRLNLGGDARITTSATLHGVTLGATFSPAAALAEVEEGLERARQRGRNRVSWSSEGDSHP